MFTGVGSGPPTHLICLPLKTSGLGMEHQLGDREDIVALDNVVHPQLTHEHQSPYRQGLHTQLFNPSYSDSRKP